MAEQANFEEKCENMRPSLLADRVKGLISSDRGDTRALVRAICLILAIGATLVFRHAGFHRALSDRIAPIVWPSGTGSPLLFGAKTSGTAREQNITYAGKDIVLVVGSDGGHPLDVHAVEIKENRGDYAAYHGKSQRGGVAEARIRFHVGEPFELSQKRRARCVGQGHGTYRLL